MSPIIFITGKGGVGKSFAAALLARELARKGRKTLLVETGGWSYLQEALALDEPVQFKPQKTHFGFDLALWTGEECLREYVEFLIKIPWLGSQFLNNSWLRSLIQVAPGLREIAFLGKVTSRERQHGPPLEYDHIVVDAVSTGHFLSLLRAPMGWSSAITVGPVYTQCQSMLQVLNDPQKVQTFLIALAEPMVVEETEDLAQQFRQLLSSELKIILNKCKQFPELSSLKVNEPLQDYLEELKNQQSNQAEQRQQLQDKVGLFKSLPFFYKSLFQILESTDEQKSFF